MQVDSKHASPLPGQLLGANAWPGRRLRREFGVFGDSKGAFSWSGSGQNQLMKAFGLSGIISALSHHRVYGPRELNFGVAGETTNEWMRRLKQAVDAPCDLMFVIGSSNDRRNGTALARSKENAIAITDALLRSGKVVVWFAETPKGDGAYALTDAQQADHNAFHFWCLTELPRRGAIVVDAYPGMVDPASAKMYPLPGIMLDGAHASVRGNYYMGAAPQAVIRALYPERYDYVGEGVPYNLDTAIRGALTPNPTLTGTTGTVTTAAQAFVQAGYQVATGWTLDKGDNAPTGISVRAYKETDADGEWQCFAVTGTLTASFGAFVLRCDPQSLSTAMLVGDAARGAALLDARGTGLVSAELAFSAATTAASDGKTTYFGLSDGDPGGAPGALSWWPIEQQRVRFSRETPTLTKQADPALAGFTLKLVVYPSTEVASDFVVRVRWAGAFKVAWAPK